MFHVRLAMTKYAPCSFLVRRPIRHYVTPPSEMRQWLTGQLFSFSLGNLETYKLRGGLRWL